MATFRQGDVVRLPFPYTDRSTRQRRPALVVSHGAVGDGGGLLWVVKITSTESRRWAGDFEIKDFAAAGLPAPSIIRPCKIATIEARHADPLGRIKPKLMAEVGDVMPVRWAEGADPCEAIPDRAAASCTRWRRGRRDHHAAVRQTGVWRSAPLLAICVDTVKRPR